jgi:2-dehydro-3-deoxyphosphooctonate aldolase (KDO 8-P synthase)
MAKLAGSHPDAAGSSPRRVEVGPVTLGNDLPLALIAGPCQIESRAHALETAGALVEMCAPRALGLIYKSSFDKANRTSAASPRGLGLAKGIEALAEVRARYGCPVLTDVHESHQCRPVADAVDVLQIPAFLCRQTDLLEAAARTGAAVHVKKGQFLAPWDMAQVAKKLERFGARRIMLGERGTSFGYNTLVSDLRGLPQMAQTGWPVVFDATHSVQQPGGLGGASGGQREFVPVLARAAVAVGVAAVFIETHPDPDRAPSDGPNMVPLAQLPELLDVLIAFDRLSKQHPVHLPGSQA